MAENARLRSERHRRVAGAFTMLLIASLFSGLVPYILCWRNQFFIGELADSSSQFSSSVSIHFIDVGLGDAIFIDTCEKDVLIDGGSLEAGQTVLSYLLNLNVTQIDLMIATHPHHDHIEGLTEVLESTIEVGQVLISNDPLYQVYQSFLELAQNHNLTTANRGQIFTLAENANLTVLNPAQPLSNNPPCWGDMTHVKCIVVKLEVGNTSFLLTGDACAHAEQSMINSGINLESNVLKVSTHGLGETVWEPATTQVFLESVKPTYAVISCARTNEYGFRAPDSAVITRLMGNGIMIYSTLVSGTIIALTNGTAISFSESKQYPLLHELKGHTRAVYSLAYSPNGELLASGSKDGTVQLWNTTTWSAFLTINAHPSGVWSVAWSSDGSSLVTGGVENKIRLWNPSTGEAISAFNIETSVAFSVSWSPTDERIAAGLDNGNLLVFDVDTSQILHRLIGHSSAIITTAWSPNGTLLASGSVDETIRIWNADTGSLVSILRANTTARSDINGLAWSSDGDLLASACQDGKVRLWDPQSELEVCTLSGPAEYWIRGAVWSPDGFTLATTSQEYILRLWNPNVGPRLTLLEGHLSPVWSVAWSPTEGILVSGSGEYDVAGGDTRILVWNLSIPVASFNWTPLMPHIGEVTIFDASLSSARSGQITSFKWDFGDGKMISLSEPTTSHIFAVEGVYTVELNITDSEGLSSIENRTITVLPISGPLAFFTAYPYLPRPNQTVVFNASQSIPGWNGTCYTPIVTYIWDFGDGNLTESVVPWITHKYIEGGFFEVALTVTDINGLTCRVSSFLEIYILFGDINQDGKVDITDIIILVDAFGSTAINPRWNSRADLDCNCRVDITDLALVISQFGAKDVY